MKIAIILGVAAALTGSEAYAQTNSTAAQSQNANQVYVNNGNTGSGGTVNTHQSGLLGNTPDVSGALFSGANPCLVGAGISVATMGTGVGLSWGHDSGACERRQDAAAFFSVGVATKNPTYIAVALDRMCDGDENRKALTAEGYVCPQDRARTVSAPVAAAASVRSPPPALVAAVATGPCYGLDGKLRVCGSGV